MSWGAAASTDWSVIKFSSNFTLDLLAVAWPLALAREGKPDLPFNLLSLALPGFALLTAAVGFLSFDLELPWIEEFS